MQNEKYYDHEVCIKAVHNIYCGPLGQALHGSVCSLLTAIYTPGGLNAVLMGFLKNISFI